MDQRRMKNAFLYISDEIRGDVINWIVFAVTLCPLAVHNESQISGGGFQVPAVWIAAPSIEL
jgi:hypothetical protein